MARFKKVEGHKTKFDYENGEVQIREPLLEDQKNAKIMAKIAFRSKNEPVQEEIMCCLIQKCCRFFDAEGNEHKFKETDILKMPASFLGELLEEMGVSEHSQVPENTGEL